MLSKCDKFVKMKFISQNSFYNKNFPFHNKVLSFNRKSFILEEKIILIGMQRASVRWQSTQRSINMYIAICDDEKPICALLKKMVSELYPAAQIYCCQNGQALLQTASGKKTPDILLLDIQLPDMDGMALAKKLRNIGWESVIIFITAYADYVFDAFDVGAFHYLVKPISKEKFKEVFNNAIKQYKHSKKIKEEKAVLIKSGRIHTTVKESDIIYAEVFNRKVVIHTVTENIEYYGKLRDLENELGRAFYRPHRAYLVNFKYITKYDSNVIYLGKDCVMMAKQNYAGFVQAYMAYMIAERD